MESQIVWKIIPSIQYLKQLNINVFLQKKNMYFGGAHFLHLIPPL